MQERGDLVRDEAGRWRAAANLRCDQIPGRVADALATRIERLGAAARDILRVAGVEGETSTAGVVARALQLDARQVVRILSAELERTQGLVTAVDVKRGATGLVSRYRFRHSLIQRYLYDDTDVSERAYLHESVATALGSLLGEDADPVAVAFQYTLAHAPGRAAPHHRRAGDQARATHALDEAIEHYQAALEHWPEPAGRAAIQRDLGECQWLRYRLADARRNLTAARAAFEAEGDLHAAGAVELRLGDIRLGRIEDESAFDAFRRAVATLTPLGDSPELAASLSKMASAHLVSWEWSDAVAAGQRAMAMAERVDAHGILAQAMNYVGAALGHFQP